MDAGKPSGESSSEMMPTGTEKNTTQAQTVSVFNAESLTAPVNALATDGLDSLGALELDSGRE